MLQTLLISITTALVSGCLDYCKAFLTGIVKRDLYELQMIKILRQEPRPKPLSMHILHQYRIHYTHCPLRKETSLNSVM